MCDNDATLASILVLTPSVSQQVEDTLLASGGGQIHIVASGTGPYSADTLV